MTDHREQREDTGGRLRMAPGLAIQIVGWIVAALLTYGAIDRRVAVLENRQNVVDARMERIENKIDRLLERR